MDLGFIRVSNEAIRKALGDKQDEIVRKLSVVMINSIQASVTEIAEQFEDIHRRLKVYPANIETLIELKQYKALGAGGSVAHSAAVRCPVRELGYCRMAEAPSSNNGYASG
jgi:hypothetical protein